MLTITNSVPPAQLLRLKALIVELTPDRVLGTIQWIEDHDVANVSIQLRPACLGANQQYCSNCTRLFYEVVSSFFLVVLWVERESKARLTGIRV